jgi:FeS assembly SUF system protein
MDDQLPKRQPLSVVQPNDKVAQLKAAAPAPPSANPSGFLPHSQRDGSAFARCTPQQMTVITQVVEVLRTIFDPEIPLNIYDLGLIYEIDVDPAGPVAIHMTLTAPGCPVAGDIVKEVERKVEEIPEVTRVNVELVWDPPWSREMLSDAAKLELGL